MKKFYMSMTAAILASSLYTYAPAVMAQEAKVINLCTGGEGGPYATAGQMIADEAKGSGIQINVITDTGGTWGNIKMSKNGECDAFIGQPDGLAYLKRTEGTVADRFIPVGDLHREYLHALCSKESGVDDIGDLENDAAAYSIALGDRGSGAWLVWQNFIAEDEDYSGVKPTDEDGDIALSSVSNNQTTCMLVPAALGNSTVKNADELYGDGLQLVGVNDGDFNDAVDPQGKALYDWKEIPSGTYANSLQGWFSAKDTISWTAKVYVNKEQMKDKKVMKTFIQTVAKARQGIISTFGK